MTQPVTYVCKACQGANVLKDAFAYWDAFDQEWKVQATFDKGAVCEDCDSPTSLVEMELHKAREQGESK
jgi:hypothetical protein